MGTGKAITIAAIFAAIVGGFMSEIGKDTWVAVKTYFNDHIQITFVSSPKADPPKSGSYSTGTDYSIPASKTIAPSRIDYPLPKKKTKSNAGSDVTGGTSTYDADNTITNLPR